DDLVDVRGLDARVPGPLGVNDQHRAVETGPQTARHRHADVAPELLVGAERLLEVVVDVDAAARAARGLSRRGPLLQADEEVPLEPTGPLLAHRLAARARSIASSIIFWCCRGSAQRRRPASGSASIGSKYVK